MRKILLCALLAVGFVVLVERRPFPDIASRSTPAHVVTQPASLAPRGALTDSASMAATSAAPSQPAVDTAVAASAARRPVQASRIAKAREKIAAETARPIGPVVPTWRDDAAGIATVIESRAYQETVSPVARLYFAFLERGPDLEGLDYYAAQHESGRRLDAIADEFAGSREIGLRYGELDDAAFVDRVFRNVFEGAGDAQQRAMWIEQLQSGALTRGQMMLSFSESPAFRAAIANEVFVSVAYAEIFGRSAEPAELSRWVRFLDAGNSGEAVIRGLLASR